MILSNLLFINFLQPTLLGVFEKNQISVVNGALWTLKIEVIFYIMVPILVLLCRKVGYFLVIVISYILSIVYVTLLELAAKKTGFAIYSEIGRQLPGQLCYFMTGAFFYYYLNLFERYTYYFIAIASFIILANISLLEPFALGTIIVFSGLFYHVGNFGKYGDFSYGIYIDGIYIAFSNNSNNYSFSYI